MTDSIRVGFVLRHWGLRSFGSGKGPVLALLAVGYALSSVVLFALLRPSSGLVYPWAANVFAVALLLRRPSVPVAAGTATVLASSLATNLLSGHDVGPALLYAAANALCVGAGAGMVRRRRSWNPEAPASVSDYFETLILAGVVAPAIAAAGFAVFAEAAIGRPPKDAFMGWLSGDMLGFSLLLPVLLFATRDSLRSIGEIRSLLRLAGLCTGIAAVTAAAVAGTDFPFIFVVVPMMIAVAFCRLFDLAIVCLLTGIAVEGLAAAGLMPILEATTERANVFQISVAVVVVLSFLGGLLLDQMRRDQRRIAESEQRFRRAMQDSAIGMAIVALDGRMIETNRVFADMLGYSTVELEGMSFMEITFEEDRGIGAETMRSVLSGKARTYQFEKRYLRKDGSPVWARLAGSVIRDEETGKPLYLISQIEDIDARKQSEKRLALSARQLAEEKERLRVTLQSIGDAVICTDASNRITFMNPTAERLVRVSSADALGARLDEIYAPVDEETGEALASTNLAASLGGKAEHNSRAVLAHSDGSRCNIREMVSPILTENGEPGGFVIVFQDFTDARTLQRELAYAAAHDALTGLANRSSFIPAMAALVDEARHGSAEHQFAFLDLDRFKIVNDTAGHAAGDSLLKKVAETIRAHLRYGDLVARLGGDEFAVVYRSCRADEAAELAARLVKAVSALRFSWEGRSFSIGVSVGLASIDAASGEVDAVIARADEACYAAKASGRGRVSCAEQTGNRNVRLDIAI